jgi:maleamate amidohydrolase
MMGMEWDKYLTDQDRAVVELSGYASRGQLGSNPALLVVDVTYAFCGDRPEPILDSVRRFRSSSGEAAWRAVRAIEKLVAAAREASVPVIYTRGLDADAHVSPGRWGAKNARVGEDVPQDHEIVADIAPAPGETVLKKAKPSAFFGTPLTSLLVERGVDSLLVCGGTTSGCVRATVVDGFSLNYPVAVVAEATFDRVEASHWMSLFDMDLKYADVLDVPTALSVMSARTSDFRSA